MADFAFTEGLHNTLLGDMEWDAFDIRVALLMSNTTAPVDDGTGRDAATLSAITLDEFDGAGYSRSGDIGATLTKGTPNNTSKFDAANITFSSISAGTRVIQAMLVYRHITNDTDAIPLLYIDSPAAFPYTADGNDLVIAWHADGIMQLKTGS